MGSTFVLGLAGRFWPFLLLGVYVVAAFGRFVSADYASSDWWPALATNHLQTLADIPRFFTEPLAAHDPAYIQATALHYRPLGTATYAIDYRLWGFAHPWGYQLTNLAVHVVVVLGVYLLGRELGLPRWASVITAIVFTSHPAIVGTVPGIGRRFDSLSAAFGLASVLLLLRGGKRRLMASAVLLCCSVFSKEISLLLVPLAVAILAIRGAPILRVLWLVPPVVLAIGLRLLVLGSLGGYGTAELPRSALLGEYREAMIHFLEGFSVPGPEIGTYTEMATRLSVLVLIVIAAAWLCPPRERSIALLGLAWFLLYAEAYAFLRVYNGWYLYQPMIGIGLLVGALASGAARRWPSRQAVPALALSGSALLVALHSSPLLTRYPEWADVSAQTTAYLAAIDTCTEDGSPPLVPKAKGPYADVVEATGLADYSVRAYLQLRFPEGRPCGVESSAA